MGKQGSSGAADGHQQSIAGETDTPVDGIRGTHAGGIEPAGDDVNHGDEQHRLRESGNAQQGRQGNQQRDRNRASGSQHSDGPDIPGGEAGTVGVQGPGGMHQRSKP